MATFTAMEKLLSLKNCYNTKIAWQKVYPTKIVSYTVLRKMQLILVF